MSCPLSLPKLSCSLPKCPSFCSTNFQSLKNRVTSAWNEGKFYILAYLAAWAIVITWAGSVYGFKVVAKNLSLGLVIGLGAGLATGGVMHYFFSKSDGEHNYSFAYFVSDYSKKLPGVMVALVTTIVVSMTINALPRFPLGVGVIAGFFMGQHLPFINGKKQAGAI